MLYDNHLIEKLNDERARERARLVEGFKEDVTTLFSFVGVVACVLGILILFNGGI